MRWLLVKDLQILRRSPGLVVLLVLYAVVIGLPVGYGISAPPAKPKVAFVNEVAPTDATIVVGGERIDASKYSNELFKAVDPIRVGTRAEAIAKVKSGEALGALIIPSDLTRKLQDAVELTGAPQLPTLQVYYTAENPIKRRYVEQTIKSRVADANAALSKKITQVASQYIGFLLRGGRFSLLGRSLDVLGLQRAATVLGGVERSLPPSDPQRAAVEQVRSFAQLAIDNLDLSGAVLGAVSQPIRVHETTVGGSDSSSLDGFAVAAAVTIALMFVAVLVGAGMLALEREEHTFGRLVRGLVSQTGLLAEKVGLAAACATVVGALLVGVLALFEHIAFGRIAAWGAALVLGAAAFGALGVVIGAITRDVRAASLLAFLLSVPIAALALVPSGTVGTVAYDVIRGVSAAFPFKPTLNGLDTGLNTGPDLAANLAHLVALTLAYTAVARLALRRFAAR